MLNGKLKSARKPIMKHFLHYLIDGLNNKLEHTVEVLNQYFEYDGVDKDMSDENKLKTLVDSFEKDIYAKLNGKAPGECEYKLPKGNFIVNKENSELETILELVRTKDVIWGCTTDDGFQIRAIKGKKGPKNIVVAKDIIGYKLSSIKLRR